MSDAKTIVSPGIDIVIVNWNSGELLADCLRSIETAQAASSLPVRVMVVDNASADGSHRRYAGAFPVELICNAANEGFARACNQGAARGTAAYILFLNPDTRIEAGVLEKVVERMERPDAAKIAVCGIQLVDDKGNVARNCARFMTVRSLLNDTLGLSRLSPSRFPGSLMAEWDHDRNRIVEQVVGAFFLVRRAVFASLRGFDEDFFVYYDDMELSLRIRRAGLNSLYLAELRGYHRGGGSTDQIRARRSFYGGRSRIIYARKFMPGWRYVAVLATTVGLEPMSRCVLYLTRGSLARIGDVIEGSRLLWTWLLFHRGEPRAEVR